MSTAPDWQRYSYAIDPEGDTTSNKVLRFVGHNKRVLELGCGPGVMTQALQQQGCLITAIEIDPAMAELARPFCETILVTDLETFDYKKNLAEQPFDVIVAADVLEHLKDPWACLRSLRELLTPDGYIVISVPNIAHNAVIAQLLAGRFPYQEKGLLDYTHLRFFTRADLEDMLLNTGFLPALWDRYTSAEEQTELAEQWTRLPQPARELLAWSSDGQTYQFIVKAYASSEPGWINKIKTDSDTLQVEKRQLQQKLNAMQQRYDEYFNAYQGAEKLIADRDQQISEQQKALQQANQSVKERDAKIDEYATAFAESCSLLEQRDQTLHEQQTLQVKLEQEISELRQTQEAMEIKQQQQEAQNQELQRLLQNLSKSLFNRVISRLQRVLG